MKFSFLCFLILLLSAQGYSQVGPYSISYANVTSNACPTISYNRNKKIEVSGVAANHTLKLVPPGAVAAPIVPTVATTTASFDVHSLITGLPAGQPITIGVEDTGPGGTVTTPCSLVITNDFIEPPPPEPSILYNSLDQMVYDQYNFGLYFNKKKNLYIKDNVVHIFMDGEGRLIITGTPTAIQDNYTYQLHVFTEVDAKIKFSGAGEYKPEFLNIQVSSTGAAAISDDGTEANRKEIQEYASQIFGPYTSVFTLKVLNGSSIIFNSTFTPAKRYHLSIVTGLLATNLQNPQNIEIADKTDGSGDKTLIADDPDLRGMVSVMAVFYPKPRSFLFEPSGLWERTGFVVGTRIDKNVFQNLLAGVQFEFARGGSITAGAHFGQRTFVPGYPNFKFGEDTYSGTTVVTKKEWDVGLFVGINLDLKIVQYFLTGGTNPK